MKHSILAAATLSTMLANGVIADEASTDPLTKLTLPTVDSVRIAGAPMQLPGTPVCKSTAQMNFYSDVKGKVDAAVAWYSTHLKGFQRTHGYASGRSQDTFYNADGTQIVSISGSPAAEGQNAEVYSIIYGKIEPGVSGKVIAGLNVQKMVCP